MKKKFFLIFITYIWAQTLFGLAIHPFTTTRKIIRRPILFPIVFSPMLGLLTLFIAGRIAAFLISVYGLKREVISLFLSVTLISILLWQALLLYLLGNFIIASWKNNINYK